MLADDPAVFVAGSRSCPGNSFKPPTRARRPYSQLVQRREEPPVGVLLMALAGLSQEDLSYLALLHRTEVSPLERGLRLPRVDTLVKLVGSLEISADGLLVGINWTPGDYQPGQFVD